MSDGKEAGPAAGPELAARYEELQKRALRFPLVEQQLIMARDRLDRELTRFGRLHAFNTRALQVHDAQPFLTTVAEAIVDVFESELGLVWLVDGEGAPTQVGAACVERDPDTLRAVGRWLHGQLGRQGGDAVLILEGEALGGLEALLPLVQCVAAVCRGPDGTPAALLLAGTTPGGSPFHEHLTGEYAESFALFAQQVSALLENRRGREIIHQQMLTIQRSEEEQRRAREQAESASRAKSLFLANTSHEIRTPMNGVLGTLQLLHDLELTAAQRELVTTAEQSANALLQIIDDILDLSKVEAGKLVLETEPYRLDAAVKAVVSLLTPAALAKGLALSLSWDPALPERVVGDAGRLRQVLLNLLSNAVKFTPSGRVDVAGRRVDDDRPGLELEVRDTGIGISAEAQGRLFSPFTQADASTTRLFGGTGLGLAISHTLVRLMGGRLEVVSAPGAGSRFVAWLPLVPEPGQSPVPLTPEGAAPRFDGRVLVVEDNAIGLLVATRMVERFGPRTVVARDGQEALDLLATERFDLVLMDCQMPRVDGLTATERQRQRERERGLAPQPIVALTANASTEDHRACLAAGMDGFLAKPLHRDSLQEVLARFLARSGQAS